MIMVGPAVYRTIARQRGRIDAKTAIRPDSHRSGFVRTGKDAVARGWLQQVDGTGVGWHG
ncbi:hypothetical protein FRAAL4177 [Frankia alni ACN14a]|uniref:Uncharacterized protein n=1 Tax=Frankia alni (strain DSM 45986 / CECT 9034 / ACN14a) TaxID=326424 RepID=Q0RI52_FRAAA|nr:hypothetical protein FRAAL4177 [Frankia alni ACN14a]